MEADGLLFERQTNGSLKIGSTTSSVSRPGTDQLMCTASNSLGNISKTVSVFIKGKSNWEGFKINGDGVTIS